MTEAAASLCAPEEVLEFWFSERARSLWFETQVEFDDEVRRRFGSAAAAAAEGRLEAWMAQPQSCLALTLLLDQVPRNIHRGTPLAFAADPRARQVARHAVDRSFDQALPADRRWFFYMPFEHSEDLGDQRHSVSLFEAWARAHADGALRERAEEQLFYVRRHAEAIERFGRFPHRNKILGRASTAAEIAFLEEPHSSF